jgi:hypothetical protein
MKIMRLIIIIAALCGGALVWTADGATAQDNQEAQVCSTTEPRDLSNEHKWRWHAYQNLSCLISKLEDARNRPAVISKNQVMLSREEVDLLLQLAWSGRDAAQRIGR